MQVCSRCVGSAALRARTRIVRVECEPDDDGLARSNVDGDGWPPQHAVEDFADDASGHARGFAFEQFGETFEGTPEEGGDLLIGKFADPCSLLADLLSARVTAA